MIAVTVAGATGWTGRAVAEAVLAAPDLTLVGALARRAAGEDLGTAWGGDANGVRVAASVDEALVDAQVLVDFTSHDAAKTIALRAAAAGVHVVTGTSGLTAGDFAEIDAAARSAGVGVVAAGNFSLTAAMAQAAALLAARFLPQREISTTPRRPSGTRPAGRPASWRSGSRAWRPTRWPCPWPTWWGTRRRGERPSPARRCTPCACPASSSRPRSCSRRRTNGWSSGTTPARHRRRTSRARSWRCAR